MNLEQRKREKLRKKTTNLIDTIMTLGTSSQRIGMKCCSDSLLKTAEFHFFLCLFGHTSVLSMMHGIDNNNIEQKKMQFIFFSQGGEGRTACISCCCINSITDEHREEQHHQWTFNTRISCFSQLVKLPKYMNKTFKLCTTKIPSRPVNFEF